VAIFKGKPQIVAASEGKPQHSVAVFEEKPQSVASSAKAAATDCVGCPQENDVRADVTPYVGETAVV